MEQDEGAEENRPNKESVDENVHFVAVIRSVERKVVLQIEESLAHCFFFLSMDGNSSCLREIWLSTKK